MKKIVFKNQNYIFSFLIAFSGGLIAHLLNFPLPWMFGPLILCGLISAYGKNIYLSEKPRPICRALLGCAIGANFSPEVIEKASEILVSLMILPVFVLLMISSTFLFLFKWMKMDLKTSIYGSLPGGLNEMVALGNEVGVDTRKITLIHSTRIVIVVICASILVMFVPEFSDNITQEIKLFENILNLPIVFLISYLGYFLGKKINLPGYSIIGPMCLSGSLHIFDLVQAKPSFIIIIIVQIFLGSYLGVQFKNISIKDVLGPMLSGLCTTLISFIPLYLSILILFHLGFEYDLLSMILSYSPGGQPEMNILALSVGADMVFVGTHHVFRVFLVIMLAAIIQKFIKKSNLD